jgi:hypothetical protein
MHSIAISTKNRMSVPKQQFLVENAGGKKKKVEAQEQGNNSREGPYKEEVVEEEEEEDSPACLPKLLDVPAIACSDARGRG